MSIKTIIFDFGGVITDSPIEGFKKLEKSYGISKGVISSIVMNNPDNNAWAKSERGEINIETFISEFDKEAKNLGYKLSARKILNQLYGPLRPVMIKKIISLSKNFQLICLTNVLKDVHIFSTKKRKNEVDHILSYFDKVYESCEIGMRKPERRIYKYLLNDLNIAPKNCVFLDDLGMNLKTAKKLGINTIKVINPINALRELDNIIK
tara:strand:- start:1014 stop:1637 length:624 start_codon:yes stop_codon:yes gene_type:complete